MIIAGGLLFCEGKTDLMPLKSLTNTLESMNTFIYSGGKYGIDAFVQGYTARNEVKTKVVIFRDRDFDREPPDIASLIKIKDHDDTEHNIHRKTFLSYRASIENYLLDPGMIHDFWKWSNTSATWPLNDSPGKEVISNTIKSSAEELIYYQATRWAIAKLKMPKRLTNHWTKSSKPPETLDENACLNEAKTKLAAYKSSQHALSYDLFKSEYDRFLDQFQQDHFWEHAQYMIWFPGKDLLCQITRGANNPLKHFPFELYFNDEWHTDQNYSKFPDLNQLVTEINAFFE